MHAEVEFFYPAYLEYGEASSHDRDLQPSYLMISIQWFLTQMNNYNKAQAYLPQKLKCT